MDADQYLKERVEQYQGWYNRKAVIAKARFLRMRAFSVLGGALVPVLANVNVDLKIGSYSVMTLAVTALSLTVVVFVSLESVFHYREQWKNYRSTEQLLAHETSKFRAQIGPYAGLEADTAFRLFVERVEEAISAENTATLNVMTQAAEATEAKVAKYQVKAG
jgi:hypothetical protein